MLEPAARATGRRGHMALSTRHWDGQATAGAAEGALGRDRPAASGSSCRWNAADQDFTRRVAARTTGGAVTAAAILAPCARKATSMPVSATAATAIRPDGDRVVATWPAGSQ